MPNIAIEPKRLCGEIIPPADKSISHRAIIIGSLAQGKTKIKNLSVCQDCLCTLDAFKNMGVVMGPQEGSFCIQGKGLNALRKPAKDGLYLGNSGTSMRLILGVLAGQKFSCKLSGDASLSQRPMKRVTQPLSLMGAKITGRAEGEFAPLTIQGGKLLPIYYETPIASAQVKSAILLAGLYADGTTKVREPAKSRDHTERMLKKFGADVFVEDLLVSVKGRADLTGKDVEVPGDISAAGFFLAGACISKGSQVLVQSVGLNPTRTAFLGLLLKMGAKLSLRYQDSRMVSKDYNDEAKGEVSASYSPLKATTVSAEQIPSLIDELPILMVVATQAEGETKICGAGELRVKETDRINSMVSNLSSMGADIEVSNNDIIVRGPTGLSGCTVESFDDHRTAMSMAIAGLVASGSTIIKNIDCVNISFPGFFEALSRLLR